MKKNMTRFNDFKYIVRFNIESENDKEWINS